MQRGRGADYVRRKSCELVEVGFVELRDLTVHWWVYSKEDAMVDAIILQSRLFSAVAKVLPSA